jgi:hypothetical protein
MLTFYLRAITNEAIAGLGAVLDDATDGFIESARQGKVRRRREDLDILNLHFH